MEKVTIPKEIAEAIEQVWESLKQDEYTDHLRKSGCLTNWLMLAREYPEYESILYACFEENPIAYVTALEHGYEVEKTPEDKLRDYYEANEWEGRPELNSAEKRARCNVRHGVKVTLNKLGIEIEGINA